MAAIGVFVSHCFPLAGFSTGGYPSLLGYISLNVFFILSGFLVTKSLLCPQNINSYVRARALRIFPALFLAIIYSTFVLGPLFSNLPASEFLANLNVYEYAFKNFILFLPNIPQQLPGVFLDSKYLPIVNAPLWSLPYEAWCYTLLAFIAVALKARRNASYFYIAAGVLFMVFYFVFVVNYSTGTGAFAIIFNKEAYRLSSMFLLGVLFYGLRHKIVISHQTAIGIVFIIGLSSFYRPAFVAITYASLGYLLLYFAYAFSGRIRVFNRVGDYSYGIYIFGYPTQQAIEQLIPDLSLFQFFIISFSVTLTLAIASWHLVEKKALKFKH